jgi:hypothetical protein
MTLKKPVKLSAEGAAAGRLEQREPPQFFQFSWARWAAFVLFGMLLVALRTPHSWPHQGFYAEDGIVFFQEQLQFGWTVIFRPYAQYLQFLTRLVALMASVAPVAGQPLIFALCSAAIQSLAAAFFLLPYNRVLVRSDLLRLGVALLILIDFPAHEMLNNIMGLQWYVMPVAVLILCQMGFSEERFSNGRVMVYSVLMFAIGLTAPGLIIVLPVAIGVFLFRAKGIEKWVPLSLTIALCIQGTVFLTSPPLSQNAHEVPEALSPLLLRAIMATAGSWAYRDIFARSLGIPATKYLAAQGGELLAIVLVAALVAAGVRISKSWTAKDRVLLMGLAGLSFALIMTSLIVRRLLQFFGDLTLFTFFDATERYFMVSGSLLPVMAAMLLERRRRSRSEFGPVMILFAIFGLGTIGNYRGEELPDKHWAEGAPAIENWRRQSDDRQPAPHVAVPISPDGWGVDLPERE